MDDIQIDRDHIVIYGLHSTVSLNATLIPTDSNGVIDWSVSNPAICSVNQEGILISYQFGVTTVNAALRSNPLIYDSSRVTVTSLPSSLSLDPDSFTLTQYLETATVTTLLNEGATGNILWESTAIETFTVSEEGVITALQTGSGTVLATVEGTELVASGTVTVDIPVTAINVNHEAIHLTTIGETFQLITSLNAGAVGTVTFSSSDTAIFTIDSNGLITPLATGVATVNIGVDGESVTRSIPLTISIPITDIILNTESLSFLVIRRPAVLSLILTTALLVRSPGNHRIPVSVLLMIRGLSRRYKRGLPLLPLV